ncbi:MAG TPA: T9SS type A sorting domain-containing protein, partial [Ferruginibacter sp.]|nr:T9SS type A sorting domain-containing protein [Ferruginibacter sp.]
SPTGTISTAGTLTVLVPVIINAQPIDKTACVNGNTSFSVTATGSNLTYQWQVSVAGGPFTDLSNTAPYSGVFTNTLTITNNSLSLSTNRYRVIVTGTPCGAVTSNTATLTINPLPVVVVTAAPYSRLYPGLRATLFTTVSPPGVYTYKWFKNGTLVPDSIRDRYAVDIDAFGTYSATVTDVNGCTSLLSNLQTISDSVSSWLFIYPNPNMGRFQVRYYSQVNNSTARYVTLFDAKGSKVYSRSFLVTRPYDRIDVNATNLQSGIYLLELSDPNGKRIAVGKVSVL